MCRWRQCWQLATDCLHSRGLCARRRSCSPQHSARESISYSTSSYPTNPIATVIWESQSSINGHNLTNFTFFWSFFILFPPKFLIFLLFCLSFTLLLANFSKNFPNSPKKKRVVRRGGKGRYLKSTLWTVLKSVDLKYKIMPNVQYSCTVAVSGNFGKQW